MPIPAENVHSVVFLLDGVERDARDVPYRPKGTGFLVYGAHRDQGVTRPLHDAVYLVTCAHVARVLQEPVIRLRNSDGEVEDRELRLDGCLYHPSGRRGDDVAVYPVDFEPGRLGPYSNATTAAQLDVRTGWHDERRVTEYGHEVYYAGFFSTPTSMDDLVPMVRSGVVGAFNQKGVPLKDGVITYTADGHLLDVRSKHGFSGSPVWLRGEGRPKNRMPDTYERFVQREVADYLPKPTYKLMGIIAGVAQDVAVVVPAQKILETLEQGTVVEDRDGRIGNT